MGPLPGPGAGLQVLTPLPAVDQQLERLTDNVYGSGAMGPPRTGLF